MRKKLKLLLFGFLSFMVVLGIVLLMISTPRGIPENQQHLFLEPFFAKQFLQWNADSGVSPEKSTIREVDISSGEITLSSAGFSSNEFILNGPEAITVFNKSSRLRSFLVVSPGLDGNTYELARFVLPAGGRVVLDFLIVPLINDVAEAEGTPIRKTEQGVLVFEIECLTGCDKGSDYLEVYADIS